MIATVTDNNIRLFLANDLSTLILARSTCARCVSYIAEVRAMQERGALGATAVGVLMLDQPGSSRFMRDNLWLANEEILPYTLLYRHGHQVDGFPANREHAMLDYSLRVALPELELATSR